MRGHRIETDTDNMMTQTLYSLVSVINRIYPHNTINKSQRGKKEVLF